MKRTIIVLLVACALGMLPGPSLQAQSPPQNLSASASDQFSPTVASIGAQYLVVWQDHRNFSKSAADIYGTRVSADGQVLDPGGISICTVASNQFSPVVASNGTNYFVVWQDERNSSTTFSDIYATRITTTGLVLETNGMPISRGPRSEMTPSVASDGRAFFVVWADFRNSPGLGQDVYGTPVTAGGVASNPNGIVISSVAGNQFRPSITSSGQGYFVTWADTRSSVTSGTDIYGSRLTSGGEVLDLLGIPICTLASNQFVPATISNDSEYFVAWTDELNSRTSGRDIYGARLSLTGTLLSSPNHIGVSLELNGQNSPAVASTGNDYIVVWSDSRNTGSTGTDVYGARVDISGVVWDSTGVPLNTAEATQRVPAIAFGTNSFLVVWEDERNLATSGRDIFGSLVSTNGTNMSLSGEIISASRAIAVRLALKTAEAVTLAWSAEIGRVYRGQYKTYPDDDTWKYLAGEVTANTDTATLVDSTLSGSPQRFYRIVQLP